MNPETTPEKKMEHYCVDAVKCNMYGGNTETPIWCNLKETTIDSVSKTSPATLTLTVEAPGATQMKVIVIALGYCSHLDKKGTGELNETSALGRCTFVVPEIPSIFLALASAAGLGLYTYKQKKANKNNA